MKASGKKSSTSFWLPQAFPTQAAALEPDFIRQRRSEFILALSAKNAGP
jgi:hypothetical protein